MQNPAAFRRYYNDHLHRKLLIFEKKRKRLLLFLFLGIIMLAILSFYVISLNIFAFKIGLFIPWFILIRVYQFWAEEFRAKFKPLIVSSLLEYIDPKLKYYHDEYIAKDTFLRSKIFPINPEIYRGEDYIMGKIGEIFFEMCELEIYHPSLVKSKLERWFEGIFFHANFNTHFEGRIVMIPKGEWQRFIPVMKEFTKYGGYELKSTGNPTFDDEFLVYLDQDANYREILTPELLETVHSYHDKSGKQVFASFYNSHLYLAIQEPYQLLEGHLFHSNLNFDMIENYYQELLLFTKIVEDFDITH